MIGDSSWTDLALDSVPILPNSRHPRQNWANNGTVKNKIYPTKVSEQMGQHALNYMRVF